MVALEITYEFVVAFCHVKGASFLAVVLQPGQ